MQNKRTNSHSGPDRPRGSWLQDAVRIVTRFVARRPRFTVCTVLLLACAAVAFTAMQIRFKTERSDLIDPDAAFHQRWTKYTDSFGDDSDIIVAVEADNSELIKQVLEDVGSRMRQEPELFSQVFYRIEPGGVRQKGLQYLGTDQLHTGLSRLRMYRPIIRGRWDLVRMQSLVAHLHYQIDAKTRSGDRKELEYLLGHADTLSRSMRQYLADTQTLQSPWPQLVPVDTRMQAAAGHAIYLMNEDGSMGFLKAFPAGEKDEFNGESRAIDRLREIIAEVSAEHPTARIGATGIPVLENDEMRRSQSDMMTASVISFIGVGIVLFIGFRGFRHPALALLMLAVGMAWAFGFTTLAVGHLNILSVSFAVILIGLGIDFGIHYLARYLELRHGGRHLRSALMETSQSVGAGIVTAAITTACAFFCATFTKFLGVAELGIIAGGGILLCAAATFLVLPALISLADKNVEPRKLPTPFEGKLLRKFTFNHPWVVFALSATIVVGLGSQLFTLANGRLTTRVAYDYNLLNLQADGLESVDVQKRIFSGAKDSLLFAVSVADTPEEARQLRLKYEQLPTVSHVEELASRLPSTAPDEARMLMQAYRAELQGLPSRTPRLPSPDPNGVGRVMEQFYLYLSRHPHPAAAPVAATVDGFLNDFERLSAHNQTLFLANFEMRTAAALLSQFHAIHSASQSAPLTINDLPRELVRRFVSEEGKWLVQIYPKDQIWDVEPLQQFVQDVRSVDPDVTGTPLQNYEAAGQIRDSYQTAAIYALAVICLILLIDFLAPEHKLLALLPPLAVVVFAGMMLQTRRESVDGMFLVCAYIGMAGLIAAVLDFRNFRDAVLTMVPPVVGGLMMFGILALLGVDLNPANMIVLPLVLGIGVDDGVHVVHDFRLQGPGYRTSSSTMNAIVLTSLTSMIGFGSMMVAAHRGLYSVGITLVVGVGSCLFVSLVMLPAVLRLISPPLERAAAREDSSDDSGQQSRQKQMKRAA